MHKTLVPEMSSIKERCVLCGGWCVEFVSDVVKEKPRMIVFKKIFGKML